MNKDRFIVVSVKTSFSVLDTVDAYREVGRFYNRIGGSTHVLQTAAQEFCDQLNADDRQHEKSFA